MNKSDDDYVFFFQSLLLLWFNPRVLCIEMKRKKRVKYLQRYEMIYLSRRNNTLFFCMFSLRALVYELCVFGFCYDEKHWNRSGKLYRYEKYHHCLSDFLIFFLEFPFYFSFNKCYLWKQNETAELLSLEKNGRFV